LSNESDDGLGAAEAFDAALITGGLPLICTEWPHGAGMWDFLSTALSDPVSALLVSAERSLAAEFPLQAQARTVLSAIGGGERASERAARRGHELPGGVLQHAAALIGGERVVHAVVSARRRRAE